MIFLTSIGLLLTTTQRSKCRGRSIKPTHKKWATLPQFYKNSREFASGLSEKNTELLMSVH